MWLLAVANNELDGNGKANNKISFNMSETNRKKNIYKCFALSKLANDEGTGPDMKFWSI